MEYRKVTSSSINYIFREIKYDMMSCIANAIDLLLYCSAAVPNFRLYVNPLSKMEYIGEAFVQSLVR